MKTMTILLLFGFFLANALLGFVGSYEFMPLDPAERVICAIMSLAMAISLFLPERDA